MDVTDFEEAMAVHFWGPLHTMRAAIPFMQKQGGGRIVNVSSIGGKIRTPRRRTAQRLAERVAVGAVGAHAAVRARGPSE